MPDQPNILPWTLDLGLDFDFAHTASDRKTLKRLARASTAPPQLESRFFQLTGELRNAIYAEVAKATRVLNIYDNRVPAPPLGRVCRQLELEFAGIFTQLAPVYADEVKLHMVKGNDSRIKELIRRLPDTCIEDPSPSKRPYTVVMHVAQGLYTSYMWPPRLFWWPDIQENGLILKQEFRFPAAVLEDWFFTEQMRGLTNWPELRDAFFEALAKSEKASPRLGEKKRKSGNVPGGLKKPPRS